LKNLYCGSKYNLFTDSVDRQRVNRLSGLIFSIIFIFSVSFISADYSSSPVVIVLDASGSMGKSFNGISRIQAAQYIINDHLAGLDSGKAIGLVAYGNGISGCDSQRLYVPVGTGNRKKISDAVISMRPSGNTPLEATLKLIERKILPAQKDSVILLISDGVESCGGDPSEVAKSIAGKYPGVKINVIGLSVDRPDSVELGKLAENGKGTFYDVNTGRDFSLALNEVLGSTLPENLKDHEEKFSRENKSVNPELQLTSVEILKNDGVFQKFKIDYTISGIHKGNYVLNIAGLFREPADPWDTIPNHNEYKRIISFPVVKYGISDGSGTLEVEFPSKETANLPILLQGDLWEITKIPILLDISNRLSVNSR